MAESECSSCTKTGRSNSTYFCKKCSSYHYPGSYRCQARKPALPPQGLSSKEKDEIHEAVNNVLKTMAIVFDFLEKPETQTDQTSSSHPSDTSDKAPQADVPLADQKKKKKRVNIKKILKKKDQL